MSYIRIKRFLDICVVLLFFPFLLVIFPIVALVVRVMLGGPIFFSQKRGGFNNVEFDLYKFRSMTDERDPETGNLLPDERRLTKFGRFLRNSSMDELPSLYNVFKGEMSFVGPRPFIADYLPMYDSHQRRRHEVLPGVTGWAQVNGRNAISWEEKFELDIWYVDNISFILDMKIWYLTVIRVLKRSDISESGAATASRFTGNT